MDEIRILYAEDDVIQAQDTQEHLTAMGIKVVGHAVSGEEVAALVANTQPDVLLMDVNLVGKVDGIEAARLATQHHDLPVVYLTSERSSKVVERARHEKTGIFMHKPFDYDTLMANIIQASALLPSTEGAQ